MSSGKVHRASNTATGIFLTTTTFLVFQNVELTIAAALGSFIGLTINPDYDVNHGLPRSFFTRIPYIAVLWVAMWKPYSLAFKHRSFWSHSPLVSTVIRALYLGSWVWLAVGLLGYFGMISWDMWDILVLAYENFEFSAMLFFCWVVQDLVHLWFDFVV